MMLTIRAVIGTVIVVLITILGGLVTVNIFAWLTGTYLAEVYTLAVEWSLDILICAVILVALLSVPRVFVSMRKRLAEKQAARGADKG